jgi:hypothetical protein
MRRGLHPAPTSSRLANFAVYLLLLLIATLIAYGMLVRFAGLGDNLPYFLSFSPSTAGLWIIGLSLGYVSAGLIFALVAVIIWRRWVYHTRLSRIKLVAFFLTGLLVGVGIAAAAEPPYLHQISASDPDRLFTLTVHYDSAKIVIGKNLTMEYVLNDNSFSETLNSTFFGGLFDMVFVNQAGQYVKNYSRTISFNVAFPGQNVTFAPGETWTTFLNWDGVVLVNGRSEAVSANYTLMSYAVLQDAAVTPNLYVVVQLPNITITVVHP